MSASQRTVAPSIRPHLGCETLEDRAVPAAALALSGASLLAFDTSDPAATTTTAITGVGTNEALVGIDFGADGKLYGLGVNAATDKATLYTIALDTGAATAAGAAGSVAFTDAAGKPIDLPAPTAGYALSFDPSASQFRVVTGTGLNFRIDPATGGPIDGNTGLAGSVAGTNPDGAINGLPAGATGVAGAAYTGTGQPGGPVTQYTLDAGADALFTQGAGNSGTQSNKLPVTLNGAPLDFTAVSGFDIPDTVRVATAGAPAAGAATAALTAGGATKLYSIDLATGAATELGAAPAGAKSVVLSNVVPKTVAFTGADFSATEAGPGAEVTLTRTGDLSAEATVSVLVSGGTATEGSDFTGTSFVATFAAGESTATVTIPLLDDATAEPDETILLTLSEPSAGTVGAQPTATVTIADSGSPAPAPAPVPTMPLVSPGVVVGSGMGAGLVTVLNPNGIPRFALLPYGAGMIMGVRVATGDVNGDGVKDIVTAPQMFSSHVKVFDGLTGAEIQSFLAFDGSYLGGLSLAAGDTNGDGKAEVVVGTALGSSHVKAFDANGNLTMSRVTAPGTIAGVNVALGDVNGDGRPDLVTGAATGLSNVRAFDLSSGQLLQNFLAYQGQSGVSVATADTDGDGAADIVTGTTRGGSQVKVFSGRTGAVTREYRAFPPIFSGGINVATADVSGDGIPDVLVTGARVSAQTAFFDGATGQLINRFLAFGVEFSGGVFIG